MAQVKSKEKKSDFIAVTLRAVPGRGGGDAHHYISDGLNTRLDTLQSIKNSGGDGGEAERRSSGAEPPGERTRRAEGSRVGGVVGGRGRARWSGGLKHG